MNRIGKKRRGKIKATFYNANVITLFRSADPSFVCRFLFSFFFVFVFVPLTNQTFSK